MLRERKNVIFFFDSCIISRHKGKVDTDIFHDRLYEQWRNVFNTE